MRGWHGKEKVSSRYWERIRRRVFERDGHRCRACRKAGRLEAHHVVRLSDGGTNDLANLRTLCRTCHIEHHRRKEMGPEKAKWANALMALR